MHRPMPESSKSANKATNKAIPCSCRFAILEMIFAI
jgi:hypothetical protein